MKYLRIVVCFFLLGNSLSGQGTFNADYAIALKAIDKKDQQERNKWDDLDWTIQNRLDLENRVTLDELYEKYGFPSEEKVGENSLVYAFMVLHHSTDCDWNEKWANRWLAYDPPFSVLMKHYFYRNYNPENGMCRERKTYLDMVKEKFGSKLYDYLSF